MLYDKISLALYLSTKGHFGYKDCYKKTIDRFEKVIGGDFFDSMYKLAHIKVSPQDEKLFLEMKEFLYVNYNFTVLHSVADWSHNDVSHSVEYYKDKLKVYSHPKLHQTPFSIFFEDDWLLSCYGSDLLKQGVEFLEENLDCLCVRINNNCEKFEAFQYLDTDNPNIKLQSLSSTKWGPTFTFQPTIVRTKEWYHALRWINKDQELIKRTHCELISGHVMKNFSDSNTPFAYFDNEFASVEHIGEEEKVRGYEKNS